MRVFVYGTLKRGFGNHRLLQGAEFLGTAVTEQPFVLLDAGFPVMTPVGTGNMRVTGEVYEVNEMTLARLDRLESKGRMYDRIEIDVLADGADGVEDMKADAYVGCERAFADNSLGLQWLDGDGLFDFGSERKYRRTA